MGFDKISDDKLFANHSRETISRWCKDLRYFHYMRARAGHNCEGDSFAAHFKYTDREDLIKRMTEIGVTIKTLDKDHIPFDPFGSYNIDNLDKIKYTIPGCDDLEQPQNVEAFGYKIHIWVQADRFEISVSGLDTENAYEVAEKDFETCFALEKEFDKLSWQEIIDKEIIQHPHCISEEKYPELYI